MPPWLIVVECTARIAVCLSVGSPDLGDNNFATRRQCEDRLKEIAESWKPVDRNGRFVHTRHTFNCRQWPW